MLYRCRGFFMLSGGTYGGVVGTILCLIQMLQNCVTNIKILSFKICKKPLTNTERRAILISQQDNHFGSQPVDRTRNKNTDQNKQKRSKQTNERNTFKEDIIMKKTVKTTKVTAKVMGTVLAVMMTCAAGIVAMSATASAMEKHPGESGYNYVNEYGKHPGESGFGYQEMTDDTVNAMGKHPGESGYNYVNEYGKHPGESGFGYMA